MRQKKGKPALAYQRRNQVSRQKCFFCESKTKPDYKEAAALQRFISDRGKIISRTRTGSCARHQRQLSRQIKRARFLSLLPFESKVK